MAEDRIAELRASIAHQRSVQEDFVRRGIGISDRVMRQRECDLGPVGRYIQAMEAELAELQAAPQPGGKRQRCA